MTQAYPEKNPSAPIRSQTQDIPANPRSTKSGRRLEIFRGSQHNPIRNIEDPPRGVVSRLYLGLWWGGGPSTIISIFPYVKWKKEWHNTRSILSSASATQKDKEEIGFQVFNIYSGRKKREIYVPKRESGR